VKIAIIGGGLFGTSASFILSNAGLDVTCFEARDDILLEASKINHNRIHLGYHYLRSKETAQQSIDGLVSFLFYYGEAMICHFPNYYAIASEGSHTSPEGFVKFCESLGISWQNAAPERKYMNPDRISASFKVPEPIFDYPTLKKLVWSHLSNSKVDLRLNTPCLNIEETPSGKFLISQPDGAEEFDAVVNASYRNYGKINSFLGPDVTPTIYEDVIIPVFTSPNPPIGLTIMDGPFCSVMPYGNKPNQFLLYHVKNSVIRRSSTTFASNTDAAVFCAPEKTAIYEDAGRYYPFLTDEATHMRTLQTIRAKHDNPSDARITDIRQHRPYFFSVLSGKMTTCISSALQIREWLVNGRESKQTYVI